jgi:hypothetical protein
MRDFRQPNGSQAAGTVVAEPDEEIPAHLITYSRHGGGIQGLSSSYEGAKGQERYQARLAGSHATLVAAGRP